MTFKTLLLGLAVTSISLPAMAQQVPNLGCYERSYSNAHLAENPNQGVASLRMFVYQPSDVNDPLIAMSVTMGNQGQARTDNVMGKTLLQGMFCGVFNGTYSCAVECDGGKITVPRQSADSITIRTGYLTIGDSDECGGVSDLAEDGVEYTTYRLNKAPAATCSDLSQFADPN